MDDASVEQMEMEESIGDADSYSTGTETRASDYSFIAGSEAPTVYSSDGESEVTIGSIVPAAKRSRCEATAC